MLHGEIKINSHEIGKWSAVNLNKYPRQGDPCTYLVNVEYTPAHGNKLVAQWEIINVYNKNGGSLSLVAKIMEEAPEHLRPQTLSEREAALELMGRMVR
jgi:hypothetical protein